MSLFTKPVTVHHRTPTGAGTDGRPTYATADTVTTMGFRHRQAVDNFDAGLVVIDEWTGYFPPGTSIDAGDTVTVDSTVFQAVSAPFPQWNHRTGATHHLEVRLRKAVR